jgi:hypothetical protein
MQYWLLLLVIVIGVVFCDVDPSTLQNKVVFGYQGWFETPNDGAKVGWRHWSRDENRCDGSTANFDLWPDLSEYDPSTLENTGMHYADGTIAKLYSAQHQSVVDKHFQWMRDFDLDGVFLQRFIVETKDPRFFNVRNKVTQNVMNAANSYGRIFAIMYDLSGTNPSTLVNDLQMDWHFLVNELKVTSSGRYQRHNGKPVVVLWGFGFTDRPGTPQDAINIIHWFQGQGCYVMGGVPYQWRTSDGDSKPGFLNAYLAFDAISPWAVGRYNSKDAFQRLFNDRVIADKELTFARDKMYSPVIWPGFSWHNIFKDSPLNAIPREGGAFFWKQADTMIHSLRRQKSFVYIAMFDEVDEGTAMFKAASSKQETPVDGTFLHLSIDGINVPKDHYLRLAAALTSQFRKPQIDRLKSDQTHVLNENDCLFSSTNNYRACLQYDAKLVIYSMKNDIIWSTPVLGGTQPYRLEMQSDGNVVVYDGQSKPIFASGNDPVWEEKRRHSTGPYSLIMQDDGNFVAYDVNRLVVWTAK